MSLFFTMQEALSELGSHAGEAARLERAIADLSYGPDAAALSAHLTGLSSRILTLQSQAERGLASLQVSQLLPYFYFFNTIILYKYNFKY